MKSLLLSFLILFTSQSYSQLKNVSDFVSLKNLSLSELHKKLKEKKFDFGSTSKFEKFKEIKTDLELWNHIDINHKQTTVGIIRTSKDIIILSFITWDTTFFKTTSEAVTSLKLRTFKKINKNGKLLEQYLNNELYLMVMNISMEGNWYFMYYLTFPGKEKFLRELL